MPEQRPREGSNVRDFQAGREKLDNKREKVKEAVHSVLKIMNMDTDNKYVEEVKVDFGNEDEGWKITLVNPSFEHYPDFLKTDNQEEDMQYKLKKEIERRDDLQINNKNGIEKVFIKTRGSEE